MAKYNNSKNFSIKKLLERNNWRNFTAEQLTTPSSSSAAAAAENNENEPRLVKIQQTGHGNIKEFRHYNSYEEELAVERPIDATQFETADFSCLGAGEARTGRYQTRGYRLKAQFLWKTIAHELLYPEQQLKNLFNKILLHTNNAAKKSGIKPQHFIFLISSQSLDYDIVEHLRTLENAADQVLYKFMICDQSNRAKGNPSILFAPFNIDVTAIELTKKRGHPGACRKKFPRKIQSFSEHFININALDRIENDDSYCLFRSLELLRKKAELTWKQYSRYRRNEQAIDADVQTLLEATGIDPDEEFYDIEICGDQIQQYYNQLAPNTYKIMAFDGSSYKPFWRSQANNYTQVLCIFHSQNEEEFHYDPIRSMTTLFNKNASYCFTCETPYHTPRTHNSSCKSRCWGCLRLGPSFPCKSDGSNRFCAKCGKHFINMECYKKHLEGKGQTKKSTCDVHKKCPNCPVIYDVRVNEKKGGHKCLEKYCKRCLTFHEERPCFIRSFEAKNQKEKRIIFADFECKTDHRPIQDQLKFQHQVNFIWVYLTCTKCIAKKCWEEPSECEICGPKRSFAWAPFVFSNTEVDCFTLAANPLEAFTHWVINFEKIELPADKLPKIENIVYTHYGSHYDNIFIFGQILRTEKVLPTLIRNGNRMYEMTVKGRGLTTTKFRDSFHLIPLKLASFVKTFGLKIPGIEGKKFFPHTYNKEENYEKIICGLPNIENYCPHSMMPADLAELKEWHQANKNSGEFSLKEILADYCRADVMILVHGLIYMRNDYLEYTGIDLFESITIPSASMKCFRKDLPTDQLALVPHMGYEKHWKQSTLGRIFVKWYAEENNVRVQSADSPEGEYKIGQYRLDGFVERPGQGKNLGIEVMGGRTEVHKMFSSRVQNPHRRVKYFDVNSMYPYINFSAHYPISHPNSVVYDKDVEWTEEADMVDDDGRPILGIIKCFVIPPRHPKNGIPVLPLRMDKRLLFPTCRKCSRHYKTGVKDNDYNCPHFEDNDRGFSASLTHPELAMALSSGYKVTRLHRALQWSEEQFSTDLFKPYMRKWLKLKYEASGWPAECQDQNVSEEERERRRQAYIDKAALFGIILDREKIEFNPGRRYIAKLALNSLWGRFGLRCRLSQSILVHTAAQMAKYLDNKQIDVNLLEHLHGDTYLICYKTKDEYVIEHQSSNIILALWTTSNARVHLMSKINEAFQGRDDVELLYMDTDSMLVEFDAARGEPIVTGDQLGCMGDEYPDHEIMEFVCLGPKSYVIWMQSKADGSDKYVWRCKGLPLNTEVMGKLSFERFKEMALGVGDPDQFEMLPVANNFRIQRKGDIMTIPMEKRLRPTMNKGNVDSQYKIRHFGYSDPDWCRAHNPLNCTCKQ